MKMDRLKLWTFGFFLSSVLIFSCYIALVQSISQAQEKKEALTQDIPPIAKTENGNITVDFKDADIHDVLKIISYKSGVNIVAGKDVQGTVTIRLVDVPWEKAFEVILKNSGFVYERDEDIIRVTTVENLSKEELSTEIFTLNYAQADKVSEAVKEILTERGKVKFDERTNQLLVTDVPSNLYKISQVVGKLDKKTHQVMIEARVIETVLDEDENLGIDWTLKASATGAARPLMFPFAFDKTYGKTGKQYFPKVNQTGDFAESVENGFPYAPYGDSDFTFGTLSFADLQFVLQILKSRAETKTLSNPKIVTLNNKEAEIHVGEDYNIPTYERNSSTGQMEVTGYKKEKIGIKLTVTPHVNAQKEITVNLYPEVSSFQGTQTFGDIEAPVFSTRKATTQIMVKDGQTIVIGGLIKDKTYDKVSKVPILGDIPVLRYLFSKTTKTADTTDLIIFVTVKLLEPGESQLPKQAKLNQE